MIYSICVNIVQFLSSLLDVFSFQSLGQTAGANTADTFISQDLYRHKYTLPGWPSNINGEIEQPK